MKHNYVLPNAHFRKDWQRYVRTYFDQPARKLKRRLTRKEKAAKIAPRPLDKLRPVVRSCTLKFNTRVRAGRGFSLAELEGAKMNKKQAQSLGITVDHRRRNASEEGYQANVARLKLYKSKLIIFPRGSKAKAGDATKEERKAAAQVDSIQVALPITQAVVRSKARVIAAAEADTNVFRILHKARMDEKLWGAREKRAKDKKEGKKKKEKKEGEEGEKEAAPAADE